MVDQFYAHLPFKKARYAFLTGFTLASFQPGVEVTGWNGMAVSTAVRRFAENLPAGNTASQFLRGLMRLTVRAGPALVRGHGHCRERVPVARGSGACDAMAEQDTARKNRWGERAWDEQVQLQAAEAEAAATRLHVSVFSSWSALPESLKREEDYLFFRLPALFDFG